MSENTAKQHYRLIWKRGIWHQDQQFVIEVDAKIKYKEFHSRARKCINCAIDFLSYQTIDTTTPPLTICDEASFDYIKELERKRIKSDISPELVITVHPKGIYSKIKGFIHGFFYFIWFLFKLFILAILFTGLFAVVADFITPYFETTPTFSECQVETSTLRDCQTGIPTLRNCQTQISTSNKYWWF